MEFDDYERRAIKRQVKRQVIAVLAPFPVAVLLGMLLQFHAGILYLAGYSLIALYWMRKPVKK